jgi:hypothetical protein
VADGVDDRHGGEEAGDDRDGDRPPGADGGDESERKERADDRAEVVHRSFEAVGATVGSCRDDIGEQCVASGDPQSAGGPRTGAEQPDLPDRSGCAGAGGKDRGGDVAADCDGAPP